MVKAMEVRAVSQKGITYSNGYFYDGKNIGVVRYDVNHKIKISYAPSAAYVGFYTGIKDSKGFKIFTHDLLEIKSKNEFNNLKGVVIFHKGECLVCTDVGCFNLNNSESEYITKGNAMQYRAELSDTLSDMLIEVKGVE